MRYAASGLTAIALIAATGCGDTSSPTAAAPAADAASAQQAVGVWNSGSNSFQYSFNIWPRGGTYLIGEYLLFVPSHAVCDPVSSTYGPGTWDTPCSPATRPIHVTVTVSAVGGRDYVDFSPHLRFVPSNDPSQWVTISTWRIASIGGHGDLRRFSILFADAPGGSLVDESVGDPTLATHINVGTGFVWRRVKHFTGYNIHSGLIDDCTPYVDDGCYPVGTVIVDGGGS